MIALFVLLLVPKVLIVVGDRKIWIDVEKYIAGVLSAENPHSWEYEYFKAHAVVVRSWSLWRMEKQEVLTSTEADQLWRENFPQKIWKAVLDTTGIVLLTPEGKIAPAFYHSTCGGRTLNATDVWGNSDGLKYIVGVKCGYCRSSPHFRWKRVFQLNKLKFELSDVLGEDSKDEISKIIELSNFDKRELRKIFSLPSSKFSFHVEGDKIVFEGRGLGHGVGFCQWGANELAKRGKSWREILKFYFPLLRIKKMW